METLPRPARSDPRGPARPWRLRRADPTRVELLTRDRDVGSALAALLILRGHGEPESAIAHLSPSLHGLHDPALLPGMDAACERLTKAIRDRETILVHGDYDVDGVTGTALLVRLLRLLGARHAWHIPDRFSDGYSFGAHSLERARSEGARVVVSVDNGTSSAETIGALADMGVDTIVTDHHEPPLSDLPPAVALVNPKLADSRYPFRDLCGGAVAFKLAWGLCQHLSEGRRVRSDLREFLVEAMAYVAIATVCDVVPLVDENRILAHFGLRSLERSAHPGLRALVEVAGLGGAPLLAEGVGFQIGPRLNAAGRLGNAATAVECLASEDAARARALARRLDELNGERKEVERALVGEALAAARPFADAGEHPVLVVAGQGWHQGVVGIVAARLAERFARPAVVIGLDGETGRGSARSVPGVDLLELLHGGAGHALRYGGHAQAAGLELRAEAVEAWRAAVCERARGVLAGGRAPEQPLWIDLDLPFAEMTPELMRQMARLEPFGERNEAPVLLSRGLRLCDPPRIVGADRTHAVLQLRRGEQALKAMAFGMAARVQHLDAGAELCAVYTPRWNTFRGQTNLELVLHDFRLGDPLGLAAGPSPSAS